MAKDELQLVGRGYPGMVPAEPITWPVNRHQSNQIQQTKGTAKALNAIAKPTVQPTVPTVQPLTTPPGVSRVRVIQVPHLSTPTQKSVTVQFNHPGTSPYFSGANVYLKASGKEPVLVAGGASSPLSFLAPRTSVPHSIIVTSVGNWGETDPRTSPAHQVRLV